MLQNWPKYRIVWVVMKTKQKSRLVTFTQVGLLVLGTLTIGLLASPLAHAKDADTKSSQSDLASGDDCGGAKTAIIKCDAKNSGDIKDNGVWALLLIIVNILTAGVGIAATGGIVYGAILYTTAEDKTDQVQQAIAIIRNVIIGLVIFALMWAGINFIIPGGAFE